MFESEFTKKEVWKKEPAVKNVVKSNFKASDVRKTQLVYWREHCLECTPPDCYHTCQLYMPRLDKRCVRLDYGIFPNKAFQGLFNFGEDLRFKKWAKLSTDLYQVALKPGTNRLLSKIDYLSGLVVNLIYQTICKLRPTKRLKKAPYNPQTLTHKAFAYLREKGLRGIEAIGADTKFDFFAMECFSFEPDHFRLILEYRESTISFRNAFEIKPGMNFYKIPIENFNGTSNPLAGNIDIYPENDVTTRIVITWLDFVALKKRPSVKPTTDAQVPAEKVKCIAWDLDNTLWDGILIESEMDELKIKKESLQAIEELDKRGIIHTIVSKNNFDEAKAILCKMGIWDYFVYPAINWAPKSSNLQQIAKRLNINIDTFALIDDQAFERSEVSSTLPEVRVYSEKKGLELCSYPEFDVQVTQTSKNRRKLYQSQVERDRVVEKHGGNYESFLKSCEMEMRLFKPVAQEHKDRCHELIQRSNQLNLSTRRYTSEEFDNLLSRDDVLCVAFDCSDRFGKYGLVGFASIDESKRVPRLIDFVISCRVAQKMVEHTFFEWLAEHELKKGKPSLKVDLIRTKRNGPLVGVFEKLPFEIDEETEQTIRMTLPCEKLNSKTGLITILDDVIE